MTPRPLASFLANPANWQLKVFVNIMCKLKKKKNGCGEGLLKGSNNNCLLVHTEFTMQNLGRNA